MDILACEQDGDGVEVPGLFLALFRVLPDPMCWKNSPEEIPRMALVESHLKQSDADGISGQNGQCCLLFWGAEHSQENLLDTQHFHLKKGSCFQQKCNHG